MAELGLNAFGQHALDILGSKRVFVSRTDDWLEVLESDAGEQVGFSIGAFFALALGLGASPWPGLDDEAQDVESKERNKSLELILVGLFQLRHGADVDDRGDDGEDVKDGDIVVGADFLPVLKIVQYNRYQLDERIEKT